MEELNLIEMFRYYLKKLPIIVLVTLLALLLGLFYMKEVQVPMYHGTTTIILVQKQEDKVNNEITQNELTVNEKLVSTYSQIIKSRRVLNQVKKELKLKATTDELAEQIEVAAVTETSIIKVTVSDKNSKKAVKIANEVAKVFKDEITKIYNLENISIIDEAIVEKDPYNVHVIKQMVIYALAGIVLSCGIVFVMFYFDNTIKNKKEIETILGLPVLAEIPVAGKLTRKQKRFKRRRKISNDDIRAKDLNNKIFDNVDKNMVLEVEEKSEKKKSVKSSTRKSSKTTDEAKEAERDSNVKEKTTRKKTSTAKKEAKASLDDTKTTRKRTVKVKTEEEGK